VREFLAAAREKEYQAVAFLSSIALQRRMASESKQRRVIAEESIYAKSSRVLVVVVRDA
jgi:hypothetical protein